MSDSNTRTECPILTIRIGEGISFLGQSQEPQYKEPELQTLQIQVEEFLERLS